MTFQIPISLPLTHTTPIQHPTWITQLHFPSALHHPNTDLPNVTTLNRWNFKDTQPSHTGDPTSQQGLPTLTQQAQTRTNNYTKLPIAATTIHCYHLLRLTTNAYHNPYPSGASHTYHPKLTDITPINTHSICDGPNIHATILTHASSIQYPNADYPTSLPIGSPTSHHTCQMSLH